MKSCSVGHEFMKWGKFFQMIALKFMDSNCFEGSWGLCSYGSDNTITIVPIGLYFIRL